MTDGLRLTAAIVLGLLALPPHAAVGQAPAEAAPTAAAPAASEPPADAAPAPAVVAPVPATDLVPEASPAPDAAAYRIGPEDNLLVSVWQNAELTRAVPVRPDGKISLPLVNDVQAAGLTPMQLRDLLKEKLAEYAPGAEISVLVSEVRSFKVSVLGKVLRPDRYVLRSPTTVLDAIALAGGFQEFANPERVVVLRPEPFFVQGRPSGQTFKRMYLNYRKVIAAGGETENFALESGDIVVVP
jgi:polysaccharide biosynthesis/export protein